MTEQRIDTEKLLRIKLPMMRELAWNDLFYFTKYILGFSEMEEQPHRELCEILMWNVDKSPSLKVKFNYQYRMLTSDIMGSQSFYKLVLLPRGSFKSSVATIGYPLWLAWHNPNLRIMIDSETFHNAKTYLSAIKDQVANNSLLRMIAVDDRQEYILEPNYKIAGGFTDEQVKFLKRTRLGVKEANLFCSGIDNAQTGMHPDVIIFDDIVSERNVGTSDQIEKAFRHYQFSLSLLEPGGILLVIGTRYHFDDMYGRLIEDETFMRIIRPAVNDDGTLYFPERLSQEVLDDRLAKQGVYIYNCQYMLNPLHGDNTTFRAEDIKYYIDWEVQHEDAQGRKIDPVYWVTYLDEYGEEQRDKLIKVELLSDLAISTNEDACSSVVLAYGMTESKHIFILDYEAKRMRYNRFIEKMFEYYDTFAPIFGRAAIEKVAYQTVMEYLLKDEMRRCGKFFRIFLASPKNKKKEVRIMALQPLFNSGTIYMKRKHKELIRQLLEFPYGAARDIVDALAYVLQMLRPGKPNAKKLKYSYRPSNPITGY